MTIKTNEILIRVENANVIYNTGSKTFFRESGKEITVPREVNKCAVKLCNLIGKLRISEFNGSKYAILPSNKIITLAPSSMGKEVYSDPNHGARKQILANAKSQ